MNRKIEVKNKKGIKEEVILKKLDSSYINKIMELQKLIVDGIEDKRIYYSSTKEEFQEIIKGKGEIIGCVTKENELISLGVYCALGFHKENYGYDIGLKGKELLKVGHIESTLVKEEYRGNNLQYIMCIELEKVGENFYTPIMMATASPYNPYSVNTFKKLGYKIVKDKIKYSGLRRYIFMKKI